MCLCLECSQEVRKSSNNCPICWTKVSTFIQIKNAAPIKAKDKEFSDPQEITPVKEESEGEEEEEESEDGE